jgi:hypothetical protein
MSALETMDLPLRAQLSTTGERLKDEQEIAREFLAKAYGLLGQQAPPEPRDLQAECASVANQVDRGIPGLNL